MNDCQEGKVWTEKEKQARGEADNVEPATSERDSTTRTEGAHIFSYIECLHRLCVITQLGLYNALGSCLEMVE